MKKLLSLVLSLALVFGTMGVLTLLPAAASDITAQNLILNGDASGVDGVLKYTADDEENADYVGQKIEGEVYGWRSSSAQYADCALRAPKTITPLSSDYYDDFSHIYSLSINNWRQAFQDVLIESGKTYRVSAKAALYPKSFAVGSTPAASWSYSMFLDANAQCEAPSVPSSSDWYTNLALAYEKAVITNDEDGNEASAYYASGDFKEYSFTFSSDDFIKANSLSPDENGKYHARFVMQNSSSFILLFDDVEMYAVTPVKSGILAGSEKGGTISVPEFVYEGDPVIYSASPFFGNSFIGWFDASGNLVSSDSNFSTYTHHELYAKFSVANQIVDGNFRMSSVGETEPLAFYDKPLYSTVSPATFEVVENTEHTDVFGDKVLKYYSNASAAVKATSQYDICIPVTVKKNTKYLFRFYFKNTTATRVGYTISSDITSSAKWDGQATIDYSAYYGTYGTKSTNSWSYGAAEGAKLKNGNAAIRTHGASFSNTDWNEMYVLFDSLENEGEIYAVIGMLASASYDHTVYLANLQFSEIAPAAQNGTSTADGGHYTVSGADDNAEKFRFTTGAFGTAITYDDTYYTVKGGKNITHSATAYYGNGFLGWYDGDTLVSTDPTYVAGYGLTPKFDYKNQITNGDFEDTATHDQKLAEINGYYSYSSANRGVPSFVSTDGIENTDDKYGNYVLKLTPSANNTAGKQKSLINIPVTVKKNTDYIWRFSYKYDDNVAAWNSSNLHYLYMAVDGFTTNKVPWTTADSSFKWTFHAQPEGTKAGSAAFTNGWAWGGSENGLKKSDGTAIHAISDNGTAAQGVWQEVYFLFNPEEDTTIFAEGADTATVYLTLGTVNSQTDAVLIDNISFSEALCNVDASSITSASGGEVSSYRLEDDYYCYTPTARADKQSFLDRDTENIYTPDLYIPATAKAADGYSFLGWYENGVAVTTRNPLSVYSVGKHYDALFAADGSVCDIKAELLAQDGIYGGYLEGDTLVSVAAGSSVTFTAVPYVGNSFDGWYNGNRRVSTDATYTFVATESLTLTAKFSIENLWPDSGFEHQTTDTEVLFDKLLYNDEAVSDIGWHSNVPSRWWNAKVLTSKPHTGKAALEATHRNNEFMYSLSGLEKNTDYALSFYWFIRNPVSGSGESYLNSVKIYDSDRLVFAQNTEKVYYSEDFQKSTTYFNSGDNTDITVSIVYYANSSSIVCDDFLLTKADTDGFACINYDSASDKASNFEEFAAVGSTYTVKSPLYVPAGKVFAGWSDGTNTYSAGNTLTVSDDVTLTATYTDFDDKGSLSDVGTFNPDDYDYSFVIMPDQQKVNSVYPGQFYDITNWITANREKYNIKGVLSVGDITEGNSMNEWVRSDKALSALDGVIPYVLAPGNHDYMENYKGDLIAAYERNTDYFEYFFPESRFAATEGFGGTYDGSAVNAYYKVTGGKTKYIIMSLEIYPRDEVLEWANRVAAENLDHKLIVVTHSHLDADGTRTEEAESGGSGHYAFNDAANSNDANAVWEKFIKLHKNMLLYISGHNSSSKTLYNKLTGDGGNTVYEMLIDNQDDDINYKGVGNLVILGFNEETGEIGVTNYSTLRNAYFKPDVNEFTLQSDLVIAKEGYGHADYEYSINSGILTTTYKADPYYGNSFAGWYDKDGNLVSTNRTFTTTSYSFLRAVFDGANMLPNGGLEYDDDLSMVVSTTNRFAIKEYEKDEGNGKYYLEYALPRQETAQSAFALPVKKNTDYSLSFDIKVDEFGANGWLRTGMAYALGNWSALAELGGATQSFINPDTGYDVSYTSAAGAVHQPGHGLEKNEYISGFDNDWVHYTITFNSGEDENVFGSGDEGTLYMMLYAFNNAMSMKIDNVIFAEGQHPTVRVDGYGTAYAECDGVDVSSPTGATALPGDKITYIAAPHYGSRFMGWYFGNERVSEDSRFTTTAYFTLTARFTNYASAEDAGFENGTTGSFVAKYDTVTFENIAHSGETDSDMGSRMLKAVDGSTDYLGFYLPAKAEANTKYLIHFSYKVEAAADTRTDIMVGPKSSWSSFSDSTFYASSSTYSYSKTGAFGQYQAFNLSKHFGDGFIEMNIIVDTADELLDGNLYLMMGAKDGATFYIDNVSVARLEDVAPYFIGASLITETSARFNEGSLSYVSGLRYISPSHKLTEIGTVAIPTQLIPAGSELTLDTADISIARLRGQDGLNFDAKKFYATFRNADEFPVSVKLSARSYAVITDKHGRFSWTFYSENEDPDSKIVSGTYDRSITQIRRLLALALIDNFGANPPDDFYSDDDVSATDNVKSSASVSSAEAWNFVKRNVYLYGSATTFAVNSGNELWVNGGFEDSSAYLGSIRQHVITSEDENWDKYSYTSGSATGSYNVLYDYDPFGWVYYSGSDYYRPEGANFSSYFSYADNSVTKPHSGDYSLRLSTRSGNANYIARGLEPNTEYELSYYWKGGTTISLDTTYVYPYIYEFFGTDKVTDSEDNIITESINGKDHVVQKTTLQRYFAPSLHQLDSEALAYRLGPAMGNNGWQKVTLRFNTGNDTAVVFGVGYGSRVNSGTIYLDDISLKKCDAVSESITDGNFQNGLKHWNGNASTYKIGGYSSASLTAAGQRLYQTVRVERGTDYTLSVKVKARETDALYIGVTDAANDILNPLTAISNSAAIVTDSTGTKTYTVDFHSGASEYVNVHLQSLVDSKTTVLSVELERAEKNIVYDRLDFEDGTTDVSTGIAPAYAVAKTNNLWYAIATGTAHSGSHSLMMKATSNDTNAATDYTTADGELLRHPLYQEWSCFRIQSGTRYTLSYYAKSSAGVSFDSAIRFVDESVWNYFKAIDSKTVTLESGDWTYVEHTFSLDVGYTSKNYVYLVLSGNDGSTANIYFDDIVLTESPALVNSEPEKLYCEEIFNLTDDGSLENGGGAYTALGANLKTDGGYKGDNYIRVNEGQRLLLPVKTYVEYNYDPAVIYTFSAAVRASSGGSGYVGISYTADGNGFFVDSDGKDASKISADSTDWTFSGFSYQSPTVSPTYLVIACDEGYIDVDAMSLFTDYHAFINDPNVETEGYDYDDTSNAIANGGTAASGAQSILISTADSNVATDVFTGVNKSVYHAFVSDCMGREYSEKQLDFELKKMRDAGIYMVRTMFRTEWAFTGDENNPWNWDSPKMQEFYNWCRKLEEYGFEVAIVLPWSVSYCVYGASSIPEVSYLTPRILDENGNVQYTASWGVVHPAIDFNLTCERYAEWGAQAVKAILDRGITNVTHALTFNEPSNVNKTLYTGAHNAQMLQLVDTLVDRMKAVTLENGATVRESIKLVGSNQANVYNAGLSDYLLENSKHGIDLYDIWTTHYVEGAIGEIVGPENDKYTSAYDRYARMMTNYLGKKPFWCDEFACQGYKFEQQSTEEEERWWGVNYATQYAALMNSGMSGGILWQYADAPWTYLAGSGGEFAYGIHMTGATRSALQTQTPYYSYYAISLLTKYMSSRDNATTYKCTAQDNNIHTSVVRMADGNWSIMVVNSNLEDKAVTLRLWDNSNTNILGGKTMYRHVYNSATVTPDSQANVLDADKTFTGVKNILNDTIPAGSVIVYTSIKG